MGDLKQQVADLKVALAASAKEVARLLKEIEALKQAEFAAQKDRDAFKAKSEEYTKEKAELLEYIEDFKKSEFDTKGELADADKEIEELKAEIAKAVKSGNKPSIRVPGALKVSWETPDGEQVEKKVKFANGRLLTPLKEGQKVSSAALMRIANGKKATAEELKAYPALQGVTKEIAIARITWLAQVGATSVEVAK